MILVLKLLLAPLLIAIVTLAGRRWGPGVSGWFIGMPLISGPISFILAVQNGYEFAAHSAVGTLSGQASVCVFSAAYVLATYKLNWWQSGLFALGVFLGGVALWNAHPLPLLPTVAILVGIIFLLVWRIPPQKFTGGASAPSWDLPARMATTALFVAGLTSLAEFLGPQLSGLISAFPIMGLVLASFTYAQQGKHAVTQLLRGSILGSLGIASFYLVLGLVLPATGSLWSYLLAAAASLGVSGAILRFTQAR